MKKSITLFFSTFLFSLCVISCSDDDDNLKLTKENGKPSGITYADKSEAFFYYEGNKLKTIKEIKGTISEYEYEAGELVSVSYSPEDKAVADGHSSVNFEQLEGNKINIESWGEPSSNLYRWELELDDSGLPQKMTEVGVFAHDGSGQVVKKIEGEFYAKYIYDSATKNLTQIKLYRKNTSALHSTYDFEYDNNPGVMSKIDLPLWYYAYAAYRNKDFSGNFNKLFYCYSNNILKETKMLNDVMGFGVDLMDVEPVVITYSYSYNKENYPETQASSQYDLNPIKITY